MRASAFDRVRFMGSGLILALLRDIGNEHSRHKQSSAGSCRTDSERPPCRFTNGAEVSTAAVLPHQ